MPESPSTTEKEKEIAELKRQIEEKQGALSKEKAHEIIGEKMKDEMPAYQPAPFRPATDGQHEPGETVDLGSELQETLKQLTYLALDQKTPIEQVLKEADKYSNAALNEELHRVLAENIDILIAKGKLPQVE